MTRPLVLHADRLFPAEKVALVAFMTTLTDTTLVNDPKFANPFKK